MKKRLKKGDFDDLANVWKAGPTARGGGGQGGGIQPPTFLEILKSY